MAQFVGIGAIHLRLTCDYDFDRIIKFVELLSDQYIISHEVTHYHCYIVTDKDRVMIRSMVNEELELKGNGQFSIAEVRKVQQMKKYILKDGYYRYKGFSDNEIHKLKRCSTKKGMSKLGEAIQVLEDKYLTDARYNHFEFMTDVIKLKVSYGTKSPRSWITSYSDYMLVRRSPHHIRTILEECHVPFY